MQMAYLVLALLAGILMNFLKRKVRGQATADILTYFKSNFRDTVVVILSAAIVFVVALETGTLNFLSAFTAGYACDSMFNRAVGDTDRESTG